MNYTSNFKKYKELSGINKYLFFLILNIFSSSFLNAQIDIKTKVDAQTYSEYSIAIDLFEKVISPNDVVSIFIPKNYAVIDRLAQYHTVFVTKENIAINSFIAHHTIQKYISEEALRQDVISLNLDRREKFKSNDIYHFIKNDQIVMLTDNMNFESNIEKSIQISPNIIVYLIQSVVKY
jgi:hypothetical protein